MLDRNAADPPREATTPSLVRGPILDRNGRILAIQTKLSSVTAWTPNIIDPEETAERLAGLLEIEQNEIENKIRESNGFLYIKRKVSPTTSRRIRELMDKGKLPGIYLEPEYGRNYPEKRLASHLIGYVGIDNNGLEGIEYTYNDILAPEPDPRNQSIQYGNQVMLTVDVNTQFSVENLAREAAEEEKAESVMLLVMDTQNGDVLSYVSIPDFDPNTFNQYSNSARRNLPISFGYEPGSVFKIFTVGSILDAGKITENSTFSCPGYYEQFTAGEPIRINCLGVHGIVDAEHIIMYSCNAGAAYASRRIEKETFYNKLSSFGFGFKTGLPLNGESSGNLRDPVNWSARSKPTIAIGQEVLVTAMQVARAATAIANEGTIIEPHIVKQIIRSDGTVIRENTRTEAGRAFSPETAEKILRYMNSATGENGTARRAQVDGIPISAKTGTSQIFDRKQGTYSADRHIASCLAVFPTDKPRYLVYAVIVNPQGDSYYGGRIAAPLVGKVINEMARMYDIPREGERVISHSGRLSLEKIEAPPINDTVPDFTGLPKRSLMPLLSREDINVVFKGEGWVVEQEPAPGTPFREGMTMRLIFDIP
ncbi:MAG: transpeptidase family protein [Spirochaetales bacterium]|nr:transpeptidase family protein [Spirochaetales bacterium]MCF7939140.1 transpeptidase family protein [Spirochaetales bacterium]